MFRKIALANFLSPGIATGGDIAYSATGDLKRVIGHYNAFQAPITPLPMADYGLVIFY